MRLKKYLRGKKSLIRLFAFSCFLCFCLVAFLCFWCFWCVHNLFAKNKKQNKEFKTPLITSFTLLPLCYLTFTCFYSRLFLFFILNSLIYWKFTILKIVEVNFHFVSFGLFWYVKYFNFWPKSTDSDSS